MNIMSIFGILGIIASLSITIFFIFMFTMPIWLPILIIKIRYKKDTQQAIPQEKISLLKFLFRTNKIIWLNAGIVLIFICLGFLSISSGSCQGIGCSGVSILLTPFVLSFVSIIGTLIGTLISSINHFRSQNQNSMVSDTHIILNVLFKKRAFKIIAGVLVLLIGICILTINHDSNRSFVTYKFVGDFTSSGGQRNFQAQLFFADNAFSGPSEETYQVSEGGGCTSHCNYTYTCSIGPSSGKWQGYLDGYEAPCQIEEYVPASRIQIEKKIKSGEFKPMNKCGHLDICYQVSNSYSQ